jgi:hypothetical protein
MKYLYNLENNGKFTSVEFNEYAEECSCHADLPKGIPPGISRSCLLDFCSLDNKQTTYLDSTSRDKPCEGTFCNAVTNIGNQTASNGGEIAFSNKVTQNCGMGGVNNDETNRGVAPGSTQSSTGSQAGVTPPSSKTDATGNKTDATGNKTDASGNKTDASGNKTDASGNKIDASGNKIDASGNKIDSSGTKINTSSTKTVAPANNNNMLFIGGAVVSCCCVVVIIIIVMISKKKKTNK